MPQNKQKRDAFFDGNLFGGMPGYRNRPGRSGLDYMETTAEAAHMEGMFYRRLFTFKLRTRNPFYLAMMGGGGLLVSGMLIALVIDQYARGKDPGFLLLVPGIYLLISIPLTINFILSIRDIVRGVPNSLSDRPHLAQIRKPEKKQPKRRKDFR